MTTPPCFRKQLVEAYKAGVKRGLMLTERCDIYGHTKSLLQSCLQSKNIKEFTENLKSFEDFADMCIGGECDIAPFKKLVRSGLKWLGTDINKKFKLNNPDLVEEFGMFCTLLLITYYAREDKLPEDAYFFRAVNEVGEKLTKQYLSLVDQLIQEINSDPSYQKHRNAIIEILEDRRDLVRQYNW